MKFHEVIEAIFQVSTPDSLSVRPRARPRHPTRRSYRSGGGGGGVWRSARIDVRTGAALLLGW